jgi:hypothetical protein
LIKSLFYIISKEGDLELQSIDLLTLITLTTLSLLISISLYAFLVYDIFPAYGQVSTNGIIKTWLDRENNIKIVFSTIPVQSTIGTPSVLTFTVQNLHTGKPIANLLANVVIVGGSPNQESPFRLTNISAVDGYFSINVIFPDKGSYQVITKITSQTHDVASLASFTVKVPATQSALSLFRGNYYYITWIGLLIVSAVGVGSFLILKNKKNTTEYKD